MKNKIIVILIGIVLALPMHTVIAFAQEPFQRNVVITGYYSPIPGQRYYVKGSIEADKRLNGNGTHGASGRPVFQGMIAAPKDYPFGTKIYIPGIGVGTVADRGGAIISNYKDKVFCTSEAGGCDRVDRLDLWMGHGDLGLSRALYQIGVKRAVATIYPPGTAPDLVDSIHFASIDPTILPQGKYKPVQVAVQGVSDSVKNEARETLKVLGFHDGNEANLEEDVYRFQQKYGVVMSKDETGAGHLGPKTREELKKQLQAFYTSVDSQIPNDKLGRGSSGDSVVALQESLKKLGLYTGEVTGKYDNVTISAVYKFQDQKNLVEGEDDTGAGYFGPRTREILKDELAMHERVARKSAIDSELPREKKDDTNNGEPTVETLLSQDIDKYDSGEHVALLQEHLKNLGYLDHEPTGYYGELTAEAVKSFQIANNIITTDEEVGAGRVGPATRATLASAVEEETKPKIQRQVQAASIVGVARRPKPSVKSAEDSAQSI
jgi:peptidoglycan hydrolase-like protein with peptidoglycan-binding domain/3D (Asp-Asp-Asp) domain-containing protein